MSDLYQGEFFHLWQSVWTLVCENQSPTFNPRDQVSPIGLQNLSYIRCPVVLQEEKKKIKGLFSSLQTVELALALPSPTMVEKGPRYCRPSQGFGLPQARPTYIEDRIQTIHLPFDKRVTSSSQLTEKSISKCKIFIKGCLVIVKQERMSL